MTTAHVRERLASGKTALGTFILEFATPGIGAICARAGADWVLYDLEHTGWSLDAIRPALAVSRREDIASFVRVAGHSQHLVSTALDAGAEGIMMPYVDTAEQAAEIAAWMHFPPAGRRGSAFGIAHDLYSPGAPADKQAAANESVMFLPQIETPAAVEAAEEIGAVEGVDVLFVGPLDLSTNLGRPGDFTNPEFLAALDTVAAATKATGTAAGIFSTSEQLSAAALERGYSVISLAGDIFTYQAALAAGLTAIRERD
ncbi:aldolase/citrate lyase family protein [Brevibacterium luteolum]|uniref:HpcH/HpaI aldolase family protein n=1 Tax=Brevibacterium luteolum TaxID=199591 RepID=UPI0021AEE79C|nr:aldolase/citrate lyase family protein [Brevibacterium luteolum]MCT1920570.1 aldolase/citrate lyase family protein [Brevibacterium luteolum]